MTDDNAKLREAVNMLYNLARQISVTGGLLDYMPFLRFIMPEFCGFNALKKHHSGIRKFLEVIHMKKRIA